MNKRRWYFYCQDYTFGACEHPLRHNRPASVITCGQINGDIVPGGYSIKGLALLLSHDNENISVEDFMRFYNIMYNGVGAHALHEASNGDDIDWEALEEADSRFDSDGIDQFEIPQCNITVL